MKCYRNITTDEVVYKEEAEEYVLNRLGITVTPKILSICNSLKLLISL